MQKFLPFILILLLTGTNLKAQCNAAFTSEINGATAQFQPTNTSGNLLHSWRFGDGISGYGTNATHTYYWPGSYMVMHIVRDSLNTCSDSTLQTVVVNFPISCNSSFTLFRDTFLFSRYHFLSTAQAIGGVIQSYKWIVDGDTVASDFSYTHTFSAGTHTVCQTIATTAGCTSSSCQTITVNASSNCNWAASFTTTASTSDPKTVSFFPETLSSQMKFQWVFSDGYSSFQKEPTHTFRNIGLYSVSLTIVDTITGCYDSVRQNIQVQGTPADSCTTLFTYTVSPSRQNQLSFIALSNQIVVSQTWFISGSDTTHRAVLTSLNPTYIFPDTGYYNVCLQTLTNTGCAGWFCEKIRINSFVQRSSNIIPSFPNPVNGSSSVSLRVNMERPGRITITIYTTMGNAIYTAVQTGATGLNQVAVPVSTLQPGQYFIDIRYDNEKKQSIFQKL